MKVLHVLAGLNPGGIETWLLNVVRLEDRRMTHAFLILGEEGVYDSEIRGLGLDIYYVKERKMSWRLIRRCNQIVAMSGVDILHSHVYTGSWLYIILGRLHGLKTIAHSHTTRSARNWAVSIYYGLAKQSIALLATARFACSNEAGISLFGRKGFNIIQYGIDPNRFKPEGDIDSAKGCLIIGHVGRFVDAKNHDFILDLAKRTKLTRGGQKIVFHLIGDGPARARILARIELERIQNVVVKTADPNVYKFMTNEFDALILPSLFEGFGIVAIEAQSCGLNVIVSDRVPKSVAVVDGAVVSLSLNVNEWSDEISKLSIPSWNTRISRNAKFRESEYSIQNSKEVLYTNYLSI